MERSGRVIQLFGVVNWLIVFNFNEGFVVLFRPGRCSGR
jgi:hypothetical protein